MAGRSLGQNARGQAGLISGVSVEVDGMAGRSLSQKPWSQAELDRDCYTPMPGDLGRY